MSPTAKRKPPVAQEPRYAPGHENDPAWEIKPGRCNCRKLGGDGLCRQGAGARTSHKGDGPCFRHGGSTEATTKHVERLVAERELAAAAARWEVTPDEDPKGRLAWLLGYTNAVVTWLTRQVDELEDVALTWGKTEHREGEGPEGPVDVTTRKAELNVYVSWLNQERDRAHRLAVDCAKLGIEERRVEVEEATVSALMVVVRGAVMAGGGDTEAATRALVAGLRAIDVPAVEAR